MGPMIFFNSEALTGGIIAAIRFDGQVAVQNIKPLGIREAVEKKTCQNASMWKKQMVDDEVVFFRCFFDDMLYFTRVEVSEFSKITFALGEFIESMNIIIRRITSFIALSQFLW